MIRPVFTTDPVLRERWIARAEQLERYAAACRREGHIAGPEGAEDAEAAAADYRRAAEGVPSGT